MSVSGAILVFHDEIDRALFLDQMVLPQPAENLSFDRSFENIRKENPGWEIRVPGLPRNNDALRYELRKENLRKWIFVHPETGAVLHTVDRADKRFVNVLLTLHYSFFAGTPGKVFVLLIGIAFAALLLTGVVLYRKSLAKVLLLRQHFSLKSKRAFFSSVHRLLGVWGLVFNILICVTGIRIGYVVASAGMQSTVAEVNTPEITGSVDKLIANAEKTFPGFEINYLRFPSRPEGKFTLLGRSKSDPSYYGKYYSSITMNYRTGGIDGIALLKDKPLADRFLTILQPLHFGDYAGLPVKLIYTIGGLLPGILAVSGFVIWRYRSRKLSARLLESPPTLANRGV